MSAYTSGLLLARIREFWMQFTRMPLYDAGYTHFVTESGILETSNTDAHMLTSLGYMRGVADAAYFANKADSREALIAHYVASAAGLFIDILQDYALGAEEKQARLMRYSAEYARQIQKLLKQAA